MFGSILEFVLQWYVWLPIFAVISFLTWRNYKKVASLKTIDHTLLILEIPRANDKKELAAEQLFASLHGILKDKKELKASGGLQDHISFEIASIGKLIRFYVWVPKHLQNFVEGQIYAQYPTVQIYEESEDYTKRQLDHKVVYTGELNLIDNDVLPIKTFQSFEVDPLAGITATLSKLEDEGEEMWIQVLVRPIPDSWHKRSSNYASRIKAGKAGGDFFGGFGQYIISMLGALWQPPASGGSSEVELSERDKTRISEIEKKSQKLGYQVKIRVAYLGSNQATAKHRLQAIVGAFKQFNSTNLNGFKLHKPSFNREDIAYYTTRFFVDNGFILNIEELASVYHLPHTSVETPSIVWANAKTAEPPSKLPVATGDTATDGDISAFGLTNFRGMNHQFGLYRNDRNRHVYVIGQTGTGKSGLLELFALSDVFHDYGYAIIDPHGDFAVDNMRFIPTSRVNDVVYFNPADTANPVGFNPMEMTDISQKNNISSEIIGVLKRMFGDSWGPRLEYILRYTILALLEYPNSTMLDITRMLTDKKFRKEVIGHVTDTVVLNFWNVEFASWNDKFASEAVAPVLNKVGAFTANPIIRNIIGQPKSTFNIREIMDEGKILIVNLSKGLIGEDNAAILGSFLVTKVQLAAMSRSDIPRIEDRRPFYLYVDEFQNFATDSFATILSEARKYGLNLTVANQYVSQMDDVVRDAVFGNVGTMISFRVSADDAPVLAKPFAPQFEPDDLLQMNNRHFIISMVISGEKVPAFSATTLQLPPPQADNTPSIIESSRKQFSRQREEVEAEIKALLEASSTPQQQASQSKQPRKQSKSQDDKKKPSEATPKTKTEVSSGSLHKKNEGKSDSSDKPKKKRTRSRTRKRKNTSTPNDTSQSSNNAKDKRPSTPKEKIGEIEIKLRH